MTRIFYDEDVPAHPLEGETVAVLGYGIQGRAQALTLRDSGVTVVVGNRVDKYSHLAKDDGFTVHDLPEAAERGTVLLLLVPDELQAQVYDDVVKARLKRGKALVFAHGFAVHYQLIEPPRDVDVLLLAPRMPGQYLRGRYLDGWGVPAFVGVHRDATGRAWVRLLGLARALGVTRCAAIETTFAVETELDHFAEHVTYPLIFHALELAFESLVNEGYPPEIALMELHGSGEMGQILEAASQEGLFEMLETHASPACKAGIAHHWERAVGSSEEMRTRMYEAVRAIRSGEFARHLVDQVSKGYPELRDWKASRSQRLSEAEASLRDWLRGPTASRYA
ncbi:MAG TPA: ketol-acid reductoisomerase [Thermoanaerobaculia bacterium]